MTPEEAKKKTKEQLREEINGLREQLSVANSKHYAARSDADFWQKQAEVSKQEKVATERELVAMRKVIVMLTKQPTVSVQWAQAKNENQR